MKKLISNEVVKFCQRQLNQKLLFSLVLLTSCLSGFAQKSFSKGDKLLNIGVGINSYYSGGIPFGASFESGITNEISAGANVDYLSNKYNYGSGYSYKFTALYIGVRASYHVNELLKLDMKKIDLYGGATLGYRRFSWSDDYTYGGLSGSYGSGIYLGAYVGGKYYFAEKIGVFAELGAIGSTNARVGVAFRL